MKDDQGRVTRKHLTLIHSVTEPKEDQPHVWDALYVGEFKETSFSSLLQKESFLFRHHLLVKQEKEHVFDQAQCIRIARRAVEKHIKVFGAHLPCSLLDEEELRAYTQITDQLLRELQQPNQNADAQQLLKQLREHRTCLGNKLIRLARRVTTREEIECAVGHEDVTIFNSDVTRLLLYRINHGQLLPRLLVLPNTRNRMNPFVVFLQPDVPPTPLMIHALSLFLF